jgi:hypothetical protein
LTAECQARATELSDAMYHGTVPQYFSPRKRRLPPTRFGKLSWRLAGNADQLSSRTKNSDSYSKRWRPTEIASRVGVASPHRPCWERMGAWLVGETAGRPFPLPVLGRLSRAQSRMAAPSPFRREPSSIFRRLSEPSHFVPSCRGTAAASSRESGAGEARIRALPFVGLRSLAVAT